MKPLPITFGVCVLAAAISVAAARQPDPRTSAPAALASPVRPVMQVFKSPTCGCCKLWVDHIMAAGFDVRVTDLDEEKLSAQKAKLGIAARHQSCHSATVDGYVIEGHVPADDIKRLLKERPRVVGLAVPGMPRGTPGMEMPGGHKDPYEVIAFTKAGATSPFAKH